MVPEPEPEAIDLSIFRKSDAQPEVRRSNGEAEKESSVKAAAEKAVSEKATAEKEAQEAQEKSAADAEVAAKKAEAEAEAAIAVAEKAAAAAADAEVAAKKAEAEADKNVIKAKASVSNGIKIVGKVDFAAQAKEAEEKKAAAAVARAKAKAAADKIVIKSAIPTFVAPLTDEDKSADTSDDLVIKTKVQKLTGPKVVGKIVRHACDKVISALRGPKIGDAILDLQFLNALRLVVAAPANAQLGVLADTA